MGYRTSLESRQVRDLEGLDLSSGFDKRAGDGDTLHQKTRVCSADLGFLAAEQNPRQYSSLSPRSKDLNFRAKVSPSFYTGRGSETFQSQYSFGFLRQLDSQSFYLNTLNTLFLEAPYTPTFSTNTSINSLDYDHSNKAARRVTLKNLTATHLKGLKLSPDIFTLRGKRDGAPTFSATSYWKLFWAHSNPALRLNYLDKLSSIKSNHALPDFTNFYDYDFRNLQAYELLEDSFWESTDASYNHLEYLGIREGLANPISLTAAHLLREPHAAKGNFGKGDRSLADLGDFPELPTARVSAFSNCCVFDDLPLVPLKVVPDVLASELTPTPALTQDEVYEY